MPKWAALFHPSTWASQGSAPSRFPLAPLRSRASAGAWGWSVRELANWRLGCNGEARPLLQWQLARGSPPPPPTLSCGLQVEA